MHRCGQKSRRVPAKVLHGASGRLLCMLTTSLIYITTYSALVAPSIGFQDQWKGTERVITGISYVHNPDTPIKAVSRLNFQKRMELGGDVAEREHSFERITGIDVDNGGTIFVLDYNACEIRKFSPDGKYMQKIGRKGKGPAEFQRPISLALDDKGQLVVAESIPSSIAFFDTQGTFLFRRSLASQSVVLGIKSLGYDEFLISAVTLEFKGGEVLQTYTLRVINSLGQSAQDIMTASRKRSAGNDVASETESRWPVWHVDARGNIYVAEDIDKYTVKVFDRKGKLLRVIDREFKPVRRSVSELERIRREIASKMKQLGIVGVQYVISEVKPIISSILSDANDRLWIVTPEGASPNGIALDIFDSQGRYVEKVTLTTRGNGNFLIKNDCLYFTHQTSDAFPTVYVFYITERR